MILARATLAPLLLLLAACGETLYFAPPPVITDARISVVADTIMVNEISIPEYAINQEIPIQRADGSLVTDTDRLWADLPDRAMQGAIVRHLNQISDASAAAEPWPLSGFPDAEVSIFVEDMIVQANSTLRLTGTYGIRSEQGRGRIETFAVTAPVADIDSYPAIIAAHEAAWLQLAQIVAGDL